MTALDASVAVAAFASWHESHTAARRAVAAGARLAAHAALETYSVLTRLPDPQRAAPGVVGEYLARNFGRALLWLDGDAQRDLLGELSSAGITGGATYDALVAATARVADARLLTLDRRAIGTYERLGAQYELIG